MGPTDVNHNIIKLLNPFYRDRIKHITNVLDTNSTMSAIPHNRSADKIAHPEGISLTDPTDFDALHTTGEGLEDVDLSSDTENLSSIEVIDDATYQSIERTRQILMAQLKAALQDLRARIALYIEYVDVLQELTEQQDRLQKLLQAKRKLQGSNTGSDTDKEDHDSTTEGC